MCKERDEASTKIDRLISAMERMATALEAVAPQQVVPPDLKTIIDGPPPPPQWHGGADWHGW